MELAAAGECDGGAPAEDGPPTAVAVGGRVGGQPGGPTGKLALTLELLPLVVTVASDGLG